MPETKEIAPEFDDQVPLHETLFVDRDCEYRRKRREARMRKKGVLNGHSITQSPAVIDEEEYTTAELKSAESKEQNGGPEHPGPQSFLDKLIRRKNRIMAFIIELPRINL